MASENHLDRISLFSQHFVDQSFSFFFSIGERKQLLFLCVLLLSTKTLQKQYKKNLLPEQNLLLAENDARLFC